MITRLILRWRWARRQRKADRVWLASGPSMEEIMRERNRRRTEWARHQALGGD